MTGVDGRAPPQKADVVIGEMGPKNRSFSMPDKAALILATPVVFLATIFKPIIVALKAMANGVPRLFRIELKSEANSAFTIDEVANIVAQSTLERVLTDSIGVLNA